MPLLLYIPEGKRTDILLKCEDYHSTPLKFENW